MSRLFRSPQVSYQALEQARALLEEALEMEQERLKEASGQLEDASSRAAVNEARAMAAEDDAERLRTALRESGEALDAARAEASEADRQRQRAEADAEAARAEAQRAREDKAIADGRLEAMVAVRLPGALMMTSPGGDRGVSPARDAWGGSPLSDTTQNGTSLVPASGGTGGGGGGADDGSAGARSMVVGGVDVESIREELAANGVRVEAGVVGPIARAVARKVEGGQWGEKAKDVIARLRWDAAPPPRRCWRAIGALGVRSIPSFDNRRPLLLPLLAPHAWLLLWPRLHDPRCLTQP